MIVLLVACCLFNGDSFIALEPEPSSRIDISKRHTRVGGWWYCWCLPLVTDGRQIVSRRHDTSEYYETRENICGFHETQGYAHTHLNAQYF